MLDDQLFRVYPTTPVIDDDPQRLGVVGSRLQTASVLPLQGGRHSLPEITLTWWDTSTDALRTTTWSEQKINVVGDAIVTQAPIDDEDLRSAAEALTSDESQSNLPSIQWQPQWLTWIALGVSSIVLAVGLLRLIGFLARSSSGKGHGKRTAKKKLRLIKQSSPGDALQLVDQALTLESGLPLSKARAAFLTRHPDASELLGKISRAAYGQMQSDTTRSELNTLSDLLQRYFEEKGSDRKRNDLPALYPHQQRPA